MKSSEASVTATSSTTSNNKVPLRTALKTVHSASVGEFRWGAIRGEERARQGRERARERAEAEAVVRWDESLLTPDLQGNTSTSTKTGAQPVSGLELGKGCSGLPTSWHGAVLSNSLTQVVEPVTHAILPIQARFCPRALHSLRTLRQACVTQAHEKRLQDSHSAVCERFESFHRRQDEELILWLAKMSLPVKQRELWGLDDGRLRAFLGELSVQLQHRLSNFARMSRRRAHTLNALLDGTEERFIRQQMSSFRKMCRSGFLGDGHDDIRLVHESLEAAHRHVAAHLSTQLIDTYRRTEEAYGWLCSVGDNAICRAGCEGWLEVCNGHYETEDLRCGQQFQEAELRFREATVAARRELKETASAIYGHIEKYKTFERLVSIGFLQLNDVVVERRKRAASVRTQAIVDAVQWEGQECYSRIEKGWTEVKTHATQWEGRLRNTVRSCGQQLEERSASRRQQIKDRELSYRKTLTQARKDIYAQLTAHTQRWCSYRRREYRADVASLRAELSGQGHCVQMMGEYCEQLRKDVDQLWRSLQDQQSRLVGQQERRRDASIDHTLVITGTLAREQEMSHVDSSSAAASAWRGRNEGVTDGSVSKSLFRLNNPMVRTAEIIQETDEWLEALRTKAVERVVESRHRQIRTWLAWRKSLVKQLTGLLPELQTLFHRLMALATKPLDDTDAVSSLGADTVAEAKTEPVSPAVGPTSPTQQKFNIHNRMSHADRKRLMEQLSPERLKIQRLLAFRLRLTEEGTLPSVDTEAAVAATLRTHYDSLCTRLEEILSTLQQSLRDLEQQQLATLSAEYEGMEGDLVHEVERRAKREDHRALSRIERMRAGLSEGEAALTRGWLEEEAVCNAYEQASCHQIGHLWLGWRDRRDALARILQDSGASRPAPGDIDTGGYGTSEGLPEYRLNPQSPTTGDSVDLPDGSSTPPATSPTAATKRVAFAEAPSRIRARAAAEGTTGSPAPVTDGDTVAYVVRLSLAVPVRKLQYFVKHLTSYLSDAAEVPLELLTQKDITIATQTGIGSVSGLSVGSRRPLQHGVLPFAIFKYAEMLWDRTPTLSDGCIAFANNRSHYYSPPHHHHQQGASPREGDGRGVVCVNESDEFESLRSKFCVGFTLALISELIQHATATSTTGPASSPSGAAPPTLVSEDLAVVSNRPSLLRAITVAVLYTADIPTVGSLGKRLMELDVTSVLCCLANDHAEEPSSLGPNLLLACRDRYLEYEAVVSVIKSNRTALAIDEYVQSFRSELQNVRNRLKRQSDSEKLSSDGATSPQTNTALRLRKFQAWSYEFPLLSAVTAVTVAGRRSREVRGLTTLENWLLGCVLGSLSAGGGWGWVGGAVAEESSVARAVAQTYSAWRGLALSALFYAVNKASRTSQTHRLRRRQSGDGVAAGADGPDLEYGDGGEGGDIGELEDMVRSDVELEDSNLEVELEVQGRMADERRRKSRLPSAGGGVMASVTSSPSLRQRPGEVDSYGSDSDSSDINSDGYSDSELVAQFQKCTVDTPFEAVGSVLYTLCSLPDLPLSRLQAMVVLSGRYSSDPWLEQPVHSLLLPHPHPSTYGTAQARPSAGDGGEPSGLGGGDNIGNSGGYDHQLRQLQQADRQSFLLDAVRELLETIASHSPLPSPPHPPHPRRAFLVEPPAQPSTYQNISYSHSHSHRSGQLQYVRQGQQQEKQDQHCSSNTNSTSTSTRYLQYQSDAVDRLLELFIQHPHAHLATPKPPTVGLGSGGDGGKEDPLVGFTGSDHIPVELFRNYVNPHTTEICCRRSLTQGIAASVTSTSTQKQGLCLPESTNLVLTHAQHSLMFWATLQHQLLVPELPDSLPLRLPGTKGGTGAGSGSPSVSGRGKGGTGKALSSSHIISRKSSMARLRTAADATYAHLSGALTKPQLSRQLSSATLITVPFDGDVEAYLEQFQGLTVAALSAPTCLSVTMTTLGGFVPADFSADDAEELFATAALEILHTEYHQNHHHHSHASRVGDKAQNTLTQTPTPAQGAPVLSPAGVRGRQGVSDGALAPQRKGLHTAAASPKTFGTTALPDGTSASMSASNPLERLIRALDKALPDVRALRRRLTHPDGRPVSVLGTGSVLGWAGQPVTLWRSQSLPDSNSTSTLKGKARIEELSDILSGSGGENNRKLQLQSDCEYLLLCAIASNSVLEDTGNHSPETSISGSENPDKAEGHTDEELTVKGRLEMLSRAGHPQGPGRHRPLDRHVLDGTTLSIDGTTLTRNRIRRMLAYSHAIHRMVGDEWATQLYAVRRSRHHTRVPHTQKIMSIIGAAQSSLLGDVMSERSHLLSGYREILSMLARSKTHDTAVLQTLYDCTRPVLTVTQTHIRKMFSEAFLMVDEFRRSGVSVRRNMTNRINEAIAGLHSSCDRELEIIKTQIFGQPLQQQLHQRLQPLDGTRARLGVSVSTTSVLASGGGASVVVASQQLQGPTPTKMHQQQQRPTSGVVTGLYFRTQPALPLPRTTTAVAAGDTSLGAPSIPTGLPEHSPLQPCRQIRGFLEELLERRQALWERGRELRASLSRLLMDHAEALQASAASVQTLVLDRLGDDMILSTLSALHNTASKRVARSAGSLGDIDSAAPVVSEPFHTLASAVEKWSAESDMLRARVLAMDKECDLGRVGDISPQLERQPQLRQQALAEALLLIERFRATETREAQEFKRHQREALTTRLHGSIRAHCPAKQSAEAILVNRSIVKHVRGAVNDARRPWLQNTLPAHLIDSLVNIGARPYDAQQQLISSIPSYNLPLPAPGDAADFTQDDHLEDLSDSRYRIVEDGQRQSVLQSSSMSNSKFNFNVGSSWSISRDSSRQLQDNRQQPLHQQLQPVDQSFRSRGHNIGSSSVQSSFRLAGPEGREGGRGGPARGVQLSFREKRMLKPKQKSNQTSTQNKGEISVMPRDVFRASLDFDGYYLSQIEVSEVLMQSLSTCYRTCVAPAFALAYATQREKQLDECASVAIMVSDINGCDEISLCIRPQVKMLLESMVVGVEATVDAEENIDDLLTDIEQIVHDSELLIAELRDVHNSHPTGIMSQIEGLRWELLQRIDRRDSAVVALVDSIRSLEATSVT